MRNLSSLAEIETHPEGGVNLCQDGHGDARIGSNFCACKLKNFFYKIELAMAGRKPLPLAIKKIKGTVQKCRITLWPILRRGSYRH